MIGKYDFGEYGKWSKSTLKEISYFVCERVPKPGANILIEGYLPRNFRKEVDDLSSQLYTLYSKEPQTMYYTLEYWRKIEEIENRLETLRHMAKTIKKLKEE